MSEQLSAAAVHFLTATGAAFALLALIAASSGDWQWMFIWLGVALIVDTVDGPLARRVGVVKVLPRFSGERLDLIVDFLTYVAVPAFALSKSDLLPESFRLPAGIAVILSSLFHMAHQESKTKDGYFVGFPAICYPALPLRLHASARRIFLHRRGFRGADFRSNSLRASGSRG
jgi:phosphatidylcholine synthase